MPLTWDYIELSDKITLRLREFRKYYLSELKRITPSKYQSALITEQFVGFYLHCVEISW